jgi:hypothetical protein
MTAESLDEDKRDVFMGTGGAPCVSLERGAAWRSTSMSAAQRVSGVFKDLKEDLEAQSSPKERTLTEEEGTCRL